MGQLVFVTPERIRPLDMSVEKAAKLVISFGIRSADQIDAGLRTSSVRPRSISVICAAMRGAKRSRARRTALPRGPRAWDRP